MDSRRFPRLLPGLCLLFGTFWIFGWGLFRHRAFQSGAFDLGIFDQGLWLIARGLSPSSSFMGFHILGDHAALILYPLAMLYRLFPQVEALLFLQALALASGSIPLLLLAGKFFPERQPLQAAIAAAYLLSPGLVNAGIYDFHPEVFAVPALLWALYFLEQNHFFGFLLACLLVLSCKEVLSLTVLFMGVALLIEKRWREGGSAVILGGAWAIFSTRVVIPHFSGRGVAAADRYRDLLGDPLLFLHRLFSLEALGYLLLLLLPIAGGLAVRAFRNPLVFFPVLPLFFLNVLSATATQRDLLHQYSLPILPFLFYGALQGQKERKPRPIFWVAWGLVGFLALGAWRFLPQWIDSARCASALERAMEKIPIDCSVVTSHEIAPHLSHRRGVFFFSDSQLPESFKTGAVLIDLEHPGWRISRENLSESLKKLSSPLSGYRELFREGGVRLYFKRP